MVDVYAREVVPDKATEHAADGNVIAGGHSPGRAAGIRPVRVTAIVPVVLVDLALARRRRAHVDLQLRGRGIQGWVSVVGVIGGVVESYIERRRRPGVFPF